jgi:hypothetical protein
MTAREYLESSIKNYNGNSKVIGVLTSGEEILLESESKDLGFQEVMDFTTGMVFKISKFKQFKNFSGKFNYSQTKNHHIKTDGSYVHGGQNSKR